MITRLFISVLQLTIAGGMASMLFIAMEKWIYKYTSAKFVMFMNIIVLFMFVLPIYKLLVWFDGSNKVFLNKTLVVMIDSHSYTDVLYDGIKRTCIPSIIVNIWLIGMILYFTIILCLYFQLVRKIKDHSFSIKQKIWLQSLKEISSDFGVTNKIKIISTDIITQPCILGILNKTILIPSDILDKFNKPKIKLILQHEILHMKRNDVVLRFLIQILNCLNWFNPLFYVVKRSLFDWIELSCDEAITVNFTVSQKKLYILTLLQLIEVEHKRSKAKVFIVSFGDSSIKTLKGRVQEIMRVKKNLNKVGRIIVTSCMVVVVMGSTVVAKAADVQLNSFFSDNVSIVDKNSVSFSDTKDFYRSEYIDFNDAELLQKIQSNIILPFLPSTDKNITYTAIMKDDSQIIEKLPLQKNTRHIHTFQKVVMKEHTKYKNGSCQTVSYEAEYCSGCNTYWKGNKIKTETSDPCDH